MFSPPSGAGVLCGYLSCAKHGSLPACFSFNRFAAIDFDGKKFLKKTIQTFSHIEPSLEAQQNELILKNKDMVKQSVLSSKEVGSLYI